MAISFRTAHSADSSSVSITTPSAGDLILVFAFNESDGTSPSLVSGYTSITTIESPDENPGGAIAAWKIASGSETTSGTWTGATNVVAMIYRGTSSTSPIGGFSSFDSKNFVIGSDIYYDAITISGSGGTSWVAGAAVASGASSGMNGTTTALTSNRTNQTDLNGLDTNGGVSSFARQTLSYSGFSNSLSFAVEILNGSSTYSGSLSLPTTLSITDSAITQIQKSLSLPTTVSHTNSCVGQIQGSLVFNKTTGFTLLNSLITNGSLVLPVVDGVSLSNTLNLQSLVNLVITQGLSLSGLANFQNAIAFTTTSGLIVIANINLNSALILNEVSGFDSVGTTFIPTSFALPANMLMVNESMLSIFPQLSLIHTSDFTSLSYLIMNANASLSNLLTLDSVGGLSISDGVLLSKILGLVGVGNLSYNDSILLDSFIRISKIGGTGIFPNTLSLDMIGGFDQSMLFSTLGTMDLTSTFGIDQSMLLSLTGGVFLNHSHFMTQRSILDAISNQTYELNTELMFNGVKITGADLLFALTGSLDQSHLYIANAGLILPVGMTQEGQSSADLNSNLALQTNIIFSQIASNLIVPVGIVLTNSQGLTITPLFSPLGIIQFDSSVGLGSTNTNTMNDSLNFPILNVLQPLGNINISESTELDNTLNLSIGGERTLSLSTSFPVSISTNFDQELLISGVLTLNSSNSIDFLSILSTLDQSHLYFNQNFDVSPSVVLEKLIELGFSTEIINFSILNGLANALFSNSLSIQADSTNNMAASVVLPVVNDLANASKLAIELGLGYQFFASLGSQVSASVPTSVSLAVVSGFGASATLTVNAIAALVMSGSFTVKQFESFNTYNEALSFASALSLTHQSILNGNATLVILTNHEMSLLNDNFRIDKNFNVVILEKNDLSFTTIDEITIQGNSDKLELNEFKSEIEWTASDLKTL